MYSFLYAQEIKIFDLFLPSFASCPFASEECLVLSWLQPQGPRLLARARPCTPHGAARPRACCADCCPTTGCPVGANAWGYGNTPNVAPLHGAPRACCLVSQSAWRRSPEARLSIAPLSGCLWKVSSSPPPHPSQIQPDSEPLAFEPSGPDKVILPP